MLLKDADASSASASQRWSRRWQIFYPWAPTPGACRWCRLEPFTSLTQELSLTGAHWLRQQALANLHHPR